MNLRHLFVLSALALTACTTAPKPDRSPAQNKDLCGSVDECHNLADKAMVKARQLAAPLPNFMEIARDENGKVLFLNFDQAKSYCESQNGRLPTHIEWAQFAAAGAEHISLIDEEYVIANFNDKNSVPSDFSSLWFETEKGPRTIYRRKDSYKKPADSASPENNKFWSSSSRRLNEADKFVFSGKNGEIWPSSKNNRIAVRCVKN